MVSIETPRTEDGAGRPPGTAILAAADYVTVLLAGATLFAMMLMTFGDVVGRYFFGAPLGFAFEATQLAMAVVVFGAFPSVTLRGLHITAGLFEERITGRGAVVRDLVVAFAIAAGCLYLAWRLSKLAGRFVSYGEVTSVLRFPIGIVAWFGVASLALSAILLLVQTALDLRGEKEFDLVSATLYGFGALFAVLFAGLPLAFGMGIIGFVGFALMIGLNPAGAMSAQIAWDTLSSYSLSVLPLFVLMGNLVNHAGLSGELYSASNAMVGHRKGGLAMATILACGGFAAVSGSSLATAATMSSIAMPSMRRYRYADRLSTASVAAGGTLGILIPPSVIMVIYGSMTETNIGALFVAGLVPGVLGILFYMGAVAYTVWRDPTSGPAGPRLAWSERLVALRKVWTILLLFATVMGGIYLGVFTATEAAGIGAFGALVIALLRRSLTLADLVQIVAATVRTTAVLMSILVGALIFANFINVAGVPSAVVDAINGLGLSPLGVIFGLIVFYIVLGAVFDELAMILLTIPVFFPLVIGLGFDPIWFGIVIVMVVEIGLICPPIGMNLFIIRTAVPDVPLTTIFRGIVPFVVADFIRLALIVLVPWLVLFLPQQMAP